jgi:hypothetical protein
VTAPKRGGARRHIWGGRRFSGGGKELKSTRWDDKDEAGLSRRKGASPCEAADGRMPRRTGGGRGREREGGGGGRQSWVGMARACAKGGRVLCAEGRQGRRGLWGEWRGKEPAPRKAMRHTPHDSSSSPSLVPAPHSSLSMALPCHLYPPLLLPSPLPPPSNLHVE